MKSLRILVMVGAMLIGSAVPVLADQHNDPVTQDTSHGAWWYFDDADALVMTSGVPVGADWCFGEPPVYNTMSSWLQADGLWTTKVTDSALPIFLYHGSVDDVIAAGCDAAAGGGEIPAPSAVGIGMSAATFTNQPEPWTGDGPPPVGLTIHNVVRGLVTYDDGMMARVRGSVSYTVVAEGGDLDAFDIHHLDITVVPLG